MYSQVGQATTIHHWAFEDGTEGGPAAFQHVESTERPSDGEVQKAGLFFSCSPRHLIPHI